MYEIKNKSGMNDSMLGSPQISCTIPAGGKSTHLRRDKAFEVTGDYHELLQAICLKKCLAAVESLIDEGDLRTDFLYS